MGGGYGNTLALHVQMSQLPRATTLYGAHQGTKQSPSGAVGWQQNPTKKGAQAAPSATVGPRHTPRGTFDDPETMNNNPKGSKSRHQYHRYLGVVKSQDAFTGLFVKFRCKV